MTVRDPFYPKYERKPEWLADKLHIERKTKMQENIKNMVQKAKGGEFQVLLLMPAKIVRS